MNVMSQQWLTRNVQINTLINNVGWVPLMRCRYNQFGKFSCEVVYARAEIRSKANLRLHSRRQFASETESARRVLALLFTNCVTFLTVLDKATTSSKDLRIG